MEWVPQLGSFHPPGPCVNRAVCFKLCQWGLVGSYHTLDRLAKVSVGGGERGEVAGSGPETRAAQSRDICSVRVGVSHYTQDRGRTFWVGIFCL